MEPIERQERRMYPHRNQNIARKGEQTLNVTNQTPGKDTRLLLLPHEIIIIILENN